GRPPRAVGGIGAHGDIAQIVLKPSHGIQRLIGGPLFRGPILGRRFLRSGRAWLRLGRRFGNAPSLDRWRRLAPRRHDFAPRLRAVSFSDDRRRRGRVLLGRRGFPALLSDVLFLRERRWRWRPLRGRRDFAPLRRDLPFLGDRRSRWRLPPPAPRPVLPFPAVRRPGAWFRVPPQPAPSA